jgi:hypothetical protein
VALVASFRIFDRWENLVFEAQNIQPNLLDAGWNGEFKGKGAPVGVYAVVIEALLADGRMELVEGEVVLVR